MTDTSSIFVVLIDADDIKHVFSTWPDHICLAACLTRDGDCSMVVFRRDERPVVPQRLLEMLDVEAQDVCIVPKVRGFETRHFLYSDERRLMALVASDPDLLDEAIDYSMNYTYALEEGLEPSVVLGLSKPAPAREPRQPATPVSAMRPQPTPQSEPAPQSQMPQAALSPLLPEFLRKSAERSHRPKFASVRRSTEGMLAAVH